MAYNSHFCIRIAMLNADTAVPNVYANMGTFGDILYTVLKSAASRSCGPELSLTYSVFDVVKGEYPTSPSDFDAFVITASAASSYDAVPWIRNLEDYVIKLYEECPKIKMFGSCFGHHIICQALLKSYGLRVQKHPNGWEIGISDVHLTDNFRMAFGRRRTQERLAQNRFAETPGRLPSPDTETDDDWDDDDTTSFSSCLKTTRQIPIPRSVRLQFVHADQVVFESSDTLLLPEPWTILGSTDHCTIQGVYRPGRVLTLQGHFEFDKFESRKTMRIFGAENEPGADAAVGDESGDKGMEEEEEEAKDDGELVAEMVIQFLTENHYFHGRSQDLSDVEVRGDIQTHQGFR